MMKTELQNHCSWYFKVLYFSSFSRESNTISPVFRNWCWVVVCTPVVWFSSKVMAASLSRMLSGTASYFSDQLPTSLLCSDTFLRPLRFLNDVFLHTRSSLRSLVKSSTDRDLMTKVKVMPFSPKYLECSCCLCHVFREFF